jgi:hypothetical protein
LRIVETCEFDAIRGKAEDVLRELAIQEFPGLRAAYGEDAEVGEGN